ncbi:Hsp20 family protein [Corynebacterium sp. 3HC-13]|uniref:Hsp20/alpha crystallin family protein n=1 Tax=Corynebacterium poyangense TaxID=2684405 RepID=UPI001CCA6EFF|nr:Hsp20/alpha crystallin family protein [Corynebacterium poyangense]MBZ8176908.1 Hsp20 family protein [Corynebacterium poyangense]
MSSFNTDPFTQFDSLARQLFGAGNGQGRAPRFMPMDLYKVDSSYILSADLPGVNPDSIDIDIDNGVLTISAQRTTSPENDDIQWVLNERATGSYRRQLTLSDSVDTERISAEYADGVLRLTLPLAERAKARKIQVIRTDTPKEIDS